VGSAGRDNRSDSKHATPEQSAEYVSKMLDHRFLPGSAVATAERALSCLPNVWSIVWQFVFTP
jgi:hypothetical protein